MKLLSLPRRGYVKEPTPLEFLPAFSKALGKGVNVHIKRDDVLPGAGGGNKTRKLDFIFGEAVQNGVDAVITCGAIQSNHCRLTLSWAVKEGIDCHLVLEERVPGSYRKNASGNNLLYHLLGAKSMTVLTNGADRQATMDSLANTLRGNGKTPLIIPAGASNTLGSTGYATCALELLQQAYAASLPLDAVFVPSGSAGTQAGMIAGFALAHAGIPVYGINVSRKNDLQAPKVLALTREIAAFIDAGTIPDEACINKDDYIGPGYSLPTEGMIEAVKLLAHTEGILLDPVYSGKAMAGMIDIIRKDAFKPGANVVFLHTGGSPALYEYTDTFID